MMSEQTDPDSEETQFDLSAHAVVFELARASYALGIGAVVMGVLVFGVYALGLKSQDAATATVFLSYVLVSAVLYVYDRHHERNLVLADIAHTMVRPLAVLYRVLRTP
jgi:hypothetical protein